MQLIFKLLVLALVVCTPVKAEPAPPVLQAKLAFTIEANLAPMLELGDSADGKRINIPITGGRVFGDKINGKVLPGGADYQLIHADGTVVLHAVYMLQTDDGAVINVVNDGVLVPPKNGSALYFRTSPRFNAPNGRYTWLNNSIFVAGIRESNKDNSVLIDVYRLE